MKDFIRKIVSRLEPSKNLIFISLAFWVSHIVLRILLLFRNNPYGFPFVSKPDWYIFHAICIDFLWICNALIVFALISLISTKASFKSFISKFYVAFHSVVLLFTLLDNEVQRFLGSHLTLGLTNTYKDVSSIAMFYDYVANDLSVPYLQFFVLVLILPLTYFVFKLFMRKRTYANANAPVTKTIIAMAIFYVASYLFINFIWTGNGRMKKLRPFVSNVYNELFNASQNASLSDEDAEKYGKAYQALWQKIEGDSLWEFVKASPESKIPFYRIPTEQLRQNETLKAKRAEQPNFIFVFMESHRGLNTGYMNPQIQPSPTPFLDSLAAHSRTWTRMHASSVPTTGGVLSTLIGIPHHSRLAQATELTHVTLPSFASIMTDSGYVTHYFSAADPAWDNLGVWMSKWYNGVHYDRNREDDSTFFDHAAIYVNDTLAKTGKPFLATFATRSNHYPFNFAAGMSDEDKQKPLTERINITMRYADRQLARFIRTFEDKDWYKNTYLIVIADHGFPLGENGVSTMNGGAYSNATWIPFLIHGKGIDAFSDTTTAAQIDVAPTILELAGIAAPNIFMGHNLLRGYGDGLSLGTYTGYADIGYKGKRLIAKYPITGEIQGLFDEGDTHQTNNLAENKSDEAIKLENLNLLDTLIKISDYSLEHGL